MSNSELITLRKSDFIDANLSYGARGLLAYLLCFDDTVERNEAIKLEMSENHFLVCELEEAGYISIDISDFATGVIHEL